MKIGELSDRTGVSIDAVRYYERRGVLTRAQRTAAGYRVFGADDVDRLLLVRQLQELGLTLDEIVDALRAHDLGGLTCASERWRLEAVRARLDDRMRALRRTRARIDRTLAACQDGHCPLRAG